MKNLSIEIGNRNTKTSEGIIFPSRYTMFKQIGTAVISYNGCDYYIGNGSYDIELNKSKKDFMPLLLSAIAKSTTASDINLVIGTPINQRDTKEEFINKLKDKTFVFEYMNEKGKVQTRLINIHKVEVILEGLGSVKYLPAAAIDAENPPIHTQGITICGEVELEFVDKIGMAKLVGIE